MQPAKTREYQLIEPGTYENLRFTESEIPPLKGTDVLVKVHAVSLQYRDLMVSKGEYLDPPAANLVPCSDMSGLIVKTGSEVKGWKSGDRVCVNFSPLHIYGDVDKKITDASYGAIEHGVLTEYKVVPAQALVPMPGHLSFVEASTLPCAAVTAYNSLNGPTRLKAGDYVVVLGTGGVSIFALQFAVAAGAIVIATSSSDHKLEVAKSLGAKHLINYKTTPDWENEVNKITNEVGADHIIEVGGANTLPKSIKAARMGGGQIHSIGFVSGGTAGHDLTMEIVSKAVTLRGIRVGSVDQFREMIRMMDANTEVTRPVVDKTFPFDQAIAAYAYLESQNHIGKVVIEVA